MADTTFFFATSCSGWGLLCFHSSHPCHAFTRVKAEIEQRLMTERDVLCSRAGIRHWFSVDKVLIRSVHEDHFYCTTSRSTRFVWLQLTVVRSRVFEVHQIQQLWIYGGSLLCPSYFNVWWWISASCFLSVFCPTSSPQPKNFFSGFLLHRLAPSKGKSRAPKWVMSSFL